MAKSVKNNLMFIAIAVAAAGAGYLVADKPMPEETMTSQSPAPQQAAVVPMRVGDARPDFTLPDLDGKPRNVSEWDGKVTVVNFWATWCPPCLKEIPLFMALQEAHGNQGLQFVGIAADVEKRVREFAVEHSINYPILVGGNAVLETAERYGNSYGALPYTVVIGRDGGVDGIYRGEIDAELAQKNIISLLEK